jgi:hypothetical protein
MASAALQAFALCGFRSKVSVSQPAAGPLPLWIKSAALTFCQLLLVYLEQRT